MNDTHIRFVLPWGAYAPGDEIHAASGMAATLLQRGLAKRVTKKKNVTKPPADKMVKTKARKKVAQ